MSNMYDLDEQQYEEFNRRYFARMMGYLRPYRSTVLLVLVLMIAVTLGALLEPLIIKSIIDDAIPNTSLALLARFVAYLIVLRLIVWQGSRWQTRLLNRTGQQVLYDLRQELFDHIQKLSFDFYDGRPVGKIMSRITSDVNTMSQFINSSVISVFTQLLSLVGIVAIMLVMNWKLALLCFSLLPLLVVFLAKVEHRLEKGWMEVRKSIGRINAHLNESITGIQVIQLFSREKRNSARFGDIVDEKVDSHMKVIILEILFWPIVEMLAAFGACLVLWYGAREYAAEAITIGALWAFISYLERFWQPISAFSRLWSQMLSAMAAAHRVFEFLDAQPKVVDATDAAPMPVIAGRVEFAEVAFGYQDGQTVLDNVSFTVEPGQTVALVGPTGAGKSTIINLLTRFYDPTSGRVRVDGCDLRDVTLKSYRSQLGIVLQDTFIFSGTIKENIEYGRLGASLEEIKSAAQAVSAHDFIARMAANYDTETEERGGTLSTGQRQLIAFARALLADPRILILDEATSSIDTETERLIQQAMDELLEGRTAFVIAHRLSTIRNADLILVIDHGRIVEQGSHESLIAQGGIYSDLYARQYQQLADLISAT